MDIAFYAALDRWVDLLADQQMKKAAGQAILTDLELQDRWQDIFRLPPTLDYGLGAKMAWAWKCFRFKHPYLSVVAPLAAVLGVLNAVFGYLMAH